MRIPFKIIVSCLAFFPATLLAQHQSKMTVTLDSQAKVLFVRQELTYFNESPDTLYSITLNDWNNAYSAKDTPLAKRFSDEFVRGFHLAREEERGHTDIISISYHGSLDSLAWRRPNGHPDLVEFDVNPIFPGEKRELDLIYQVKVPSDRFTKYGYTDFGGFELKDWFLTPARHENHEFIKYSNNNLDDIANAVCDYDIHLRLLEKFTVESDLDYLEYIDQEGLHVRNLKGNSRLNFGLSIAPKIPFLSFKNEIVDVRNGIVDKKTDDIRKAIIIDRIVHFVDDNMGKYPFEKIAVSQIDYERNPFYGLNQLPSFINVFTEDFIYELKFLKTYTNNYLKNTLTIDPRKDSWIHDGLQVWLMMKYMDALHPDMKMMGKLNNIGVLRNYNVTNVGFNEQYSYFYMLMARKNLDQPIGDPKNTFIKFNEQIAGKYRAGLSLKYLDSYLGNGIVDKSIVELMQLSRQKIVSEIDFEILLKKNSDKNIDWFFTTVIHSRDIIDYKFGKVSKTNDQVTFSIKDKTGANVPIPVYGVKKGTVVFTKWLENTNRDSTYTVERNGADKLVLNYKNEVPEFNLRNNHKSLKSFSNRPFKFIFFKDLEDPYYNQILYMPTLTYNLYDGLTPGLRLYNKTILDKPITFDVNPSYSTKTQSMTGSMSLGVNKYYRDSRLYNMRYFVTGTLFHYAPDATYLKINPSVQFRIRQDDFRDNRKQIITLRQVILQRERTTYLVDGDTENYSVFNARYSNSKTEVTRHVNLSTDFQAAKDFGKASAEVQFRKLFDNNRQINVRLYAGSFLYNKTNTDYFSFALDRPTDYLFDYNYYGRSETNGFFSQQLILAEGGFKSKLDTPYANQWITTLNAGFNIWNWVEIYGDAGFVKNRHVPATFVYDSGIRLNLVTDYFELYFPVYSNNGWEIGDKNYGEKIRFIVTLSPSTLLNLFTRKWL